MKFCWWCGRKFQCYGRRRYKKEVDGHVRELHKGCLTLPPEREQTELHRLVDEVNEETGSDVSLEELDPDDWD